jgi:hypothetical protein
MTTKKAAAHVKAHPAEYGAAGIYAALLAFLKSRGVSDEEAYAIIGAIAAVTPAIMTWLRNRGYI